MALTDKIKWYVGITEDGVLEVRRSRIIVEDTKELTELLSRYSLEPGQDVTSQPAKIKALAAFLWTPAVIAAWQAKKAAAIIIPT